MRIGVTVAGNRVSLMVDDSGPGIAPEERPKLFDRFHRATDQGNGAGLGLAIADSVVRATGGEWQRRSGRSGWRTHGGVAGTAHREQEVLTTRENHPSLLFSTAAPKTTPIAG